MIVDKSGEGEVVEKVRKIFPDICIAILSQALVIESVNLRDLTGLVVTTEDSDALRVANLERDKESYSLNREISTIDIVAWCLISDASEYDGMWYLPMNR